MILNFKTIKKLNNLYCKFKTVILIKLFFSRIML